MEPQKKKLQKEDLIAAANTHLTGTKLLINILNFFETVNPRATIEEDGSVRNIALKTTKQTIDSNIEKAHEFPHEYKKGDLQKFEAMKNFLKDYS